MDENEATTKDMANLIELLLDKDEIYWVPRIEGELVKIW
jgi:hypothetical protein